MIGAVVYQKVCVLILGVVMKGRERMCLNRFIYSCQNMIICFIIEFKKFNVT
jgi:hypothetical protein